MLLILQLYTMVFCQLGLEKKTKSESLIFDLCLGVQFQNSVDSITSFTSIDIHMLHLLHVRTLWQYPCWCRFTCHNQDLWSCMGWHSCHFPSELSYCIGSKYKFWNLFLNSLHGHTSTLPENIFGHFIRTMDKISHWNLYRMRHHDPVIHNSHVKQLLWLCYCIQQILYCQSVQPRVKQWWLRNSLPKIKGLVNLSHTTNLCVQN